MNLMELAALGYTCGAESLEEALTMVELHDDAWPAEQLVELQKCIDGVDLAQRCSDVLGAQQCAKLDSDLDEVMSRSAKRDGQTLIGHTFEPRDPPETHQCRVCGWPEGNHLL